MTEEQKDWIDNADYAALLRKWRFEPATSLYFGNDKIYKYFVDKMNILARKMTQEEKVTASKKLGWSP